MFAKTLMISTRLLGWAFVLLMFMTRWQSLISDVWCFGGIVAVLLWKVVERQYVIKVVKPLSLILDSQGEIVRTIRKGKVVVWQASLKRHNWKIFEIERWTSWLTAHDSHCITIESGNMKYTLTTGSLKECLKYKNLFTPVIMAFLAQHEQVCEKCLPSSGIYDQMDALLLYHLAEFVSEHQPASGSNPYSAEGYQRIKRQAEEYFTKVLADIHVEFRDFTLRYW